MAVSTKKRALPNGGVHFVYQDKIPYSSRLKHCAKAGISIASVTKMGNVGYVTTEVLAKICAAMDVKIAVNKPTARRI